MNGAREERRRAEIDALLREIELYEKDSFLGEGLCIREWNELCRLRDARKGKTKKP
jgi:hypothetical protein